jgi:hypothetical protein
MTFDCKKRLDPETIEGDYAEAHQRESQKWNNVVIDQEFNNYERME